MAREIRAQFRIISFVLREVDGVVGGVTSHLTVPPRMDACSPRRQLPPTPPPICAAVSCFSPPSATSGNRSCQLPPPLLAMFLRPSPLYLLFVFLFCLYIGSELAEASVTSEATEHTGNTVLTVKKHGHCRANYAGTRQVQTLCSMYAREIEGRD